MAKPIDYSVWDNIEISDDEDDTHPNIDTPSLFRWRHQARVDRMDQAKKEKEEVHTQLTSNQTKLLEMKKKIKEAEDKATAEELSKLKIELSELQKQEDDYMKKEAELKEKEKTTPWNVDTLCKEGKSKTIINKIARKKDENLTEEEKWTKQEKFQNDNEKLIKKYGMMKKYEDSQAILSDQPQLTCEETANYLVLWCINLEVEEKSSLMEQVAHQTIVMQFILELAKQLDADPRSCVRAFFTRIKQAEKQYMDAFNDELNSFKDRVRGRAQARIEEAMKKVEEEEKQKRMGPGGLDPVEVYESLPQEMQDCFEAKDIPRLQEIIMSLPREDAEYHMKRCVDSGLWVPNADDGAENTETGLKRKDAAEEDTYESVGSSVDPPSPKISAEDID